MPQISQGRVQSGTGDVIFVPQTITGTPEVGDLASVGATVASAPATISPSAPPAAVATALAIDYGTAASLTGLGSYLPFANASGTDTYIASPTPTWTSYVDGQSIVLLIENANTGAATLNLSGLGAVPIVGSDGTSTLGTGDLAALAYYTFTYYQGNFTFAASNPPYYFGKDTGAADAYVVAPSPTFPSMFTGMSVAVEIAHNNTGNAAATLNVGFGAKTIAGTNGVANALVAGKTYLFSYNGTAFSFVPAAFPIVGVNGGASGLILVGDGRHNAIASPAVVFGSSNTLDDTAIDCAVFGTGNTLITNAAANGVFGYTNTITKNAGLVAGSSNTVGSISSLTLGTNNTVSNDSPSIVAGAGNTTSGTGYALVIGSGSSSTAKAIAFGDTNTVSADFSVAIGSNNTINSSAGKNLVLGSANTTSQTTNIIIGDANTVSAQISAIFGEANTVSGANNIVVGNSNTVGNAAFSSVFGSSHNISGKLTAAFGTNASDNGNAGAVIHSAYPPTGATRPGGAQREEYVLTGYTTNTSSVHLTADGSAPGTSNIANLPNNSAAMFSIQLLAFNQSTQAALTWSLTGGLIVRGANAAATVMGSGNPAFVAGPTTATPPTVGLPTVAADTTNGGFNISWTPPSGNSTPWTVIANLTMVRTGI